LSARSAKGENGTDANGACPRLLVVFDSPSVRETVSIIEFGEDFEIVVCDTPETAHERIGEIGPDLVAICVVTSPDRSLQMCREIKAGQAGYLPVVLLPVRCTPKDLKRAYAAGADDCVPITLSPEQVAMRLRSLLRAKASQDRAMEGADSARSRARDLAKANLEAADLVMEIEERERRIREQNDELERRAKSLASANAEAARLVMEIEERDRRISEQADEITRHLETIEAELEVAKDLQIQLLPSRHPDVKGFAISDRFIAAAELCGDYYDYFLVEDGCLDVVIADVTGHGVAAALVALQIRALTRSEANAELAPAELVARLNKYMCESFDKRYLMSLFYLRISPADGRVEYVGAGHNPFAVARRSGAIEMCRSQGLIMGVRSDAEYVSDFVELGGGDRLLLYTDGLVEVMDENEDDWGYERLKEALSAGRTVPGRDLLDRLVTEARYHGRIREFPDDVTMVLLERTGGGA